MNETARKIAEKVSLAGGRAYFVGGCVRDFLRGSESCDFDIEVHGIPADTLFNLLKEIGTPMAYGSAFGVYSLKGENIDIALPRKEHSTGRGHKDFEIYTDPYIGPAEAAKRRDFTVNAMMMDILSGEILDFYGGREDLKAGIVRHVDDESFAEDPLRLLRAARFAARFGFEIDPKTIEICSKIDTTELSRERVEAELKKALLKSDKPSVFFEALKAMGQLKPWFSELEDLIGLEQDAVFHPEGDVWVHTMEVLDRAAAYRDKTHNPYAFMLLALLHDLGKIVCTGESNGRIHAYGHEVLGMPLVEAFLGRLTAEKRVIEYLLNMVPLHMKPNVLAFSRAAVKSTNKMFDEAVEPEDLIYFAMSDKPVVSGNTPFTGDSGFLFGRLEIYRKTMTGPYISGKDLEDAGIAPGEYYSELLDYAHKLRLAGIDRGIALKQVLGESKKIIRKSQNSK